MTGPEGNSEFCFPRISMFPETKSRGTLRFQGNKIHCSPRDQSLSDLLYSKTKQKLNLKTALRFQRSRATAVNILRVTLNCLPFDVIVFAMLAANGIWGKQFHCQMSCDHELVDEWARCSGKYASYTIIHIVPNFTYLLRKKYLFPKMPKSHPKSYTKPPNSGS